MKSFFFLGEKSDKAQELSDKSQGKNSDKSQEFFKNSDKSQEFFLIK